VSNLGRIVVVVLAVAAAIVLFVVLGSGDDSDEPATTQATETVTPPDRERPQDKPKPPSEAEVPVITIEGGQPKGGVQELEFTAGDEVRFEVRSDVAEHVHVHGYDVIQDVTPGKPVVFAFPADVEGVFEVELEDSATPIAELTVSPG
jgi:hypothetical protein